MNAGDVLPALERTITQTAMIAYAAATWDWHRLHYDRDYVDKAGLPGPVVDGQMLGALMAEQVLDAAGPRARLTHLAYRFKAMVFAGDTVRIEGTVAAVEDGIATIEQTVRAGDRLAAHGEAKVRLP